jgi:hypothetical protein
MCCNYFFKFIILIHLANYRVRSRFYYRIMIISVFDDCKLLKTTAFIGLRNGRRHLTFALTRPSIRPFSYDKIASVTRLAITIAISLDLFLCSVGHAVLRSPFNHYVISIFGPHICNEHGLVDRIEYSVKKRL